MKCRALRQRLGGKDDTMNNMNTTTDRALGWDDEFTNVSQDFVLLPEGE